MKNFVFFVFMIFLSIKLFSQTDIKDSLNTFYNDRVIVTATKYEIELKKMSISVNSINNNLIQTQISSNPSIGEYVRYTPGVNVAHGNRNYPAWVHLRGTGYFYGRTLYMSDEIPLNDPRLSLALHPDQLSGMEVILGPASSLYGPNAAGGAVNTKSKTGRDLQGIIVGQALGTFGTYRPLLSIGKASENWDFYTSFTMDKSKGYKGTDLATGVYLFKNNVPTYLNSVSIDDEKYTNSFFSANAGYRNDINSFGVSAGIHYFYEDKYWGRENNMVDGSRYITNGKMYYTIPDVLKSTLRVGFQNFRNFTQNTKGSQKVLNKDINGRFVFVRVDTNYSFVYDPTISNHADITITNLPIDLQNDIYIFKDHILTIGGTYTREESRSKTSNADRSKVLSETNYNINRIALYTQTLSQFFSNSLSVLLSVRYDAWNFSDIYDLESGDKSPKEIDKETFTFRGGVKYFVNDDFQLKANFGTAFFPGSNVWLFQNISTGTLWREANPNLKPEKTRMADLGFDYLLQNHSLKLSAVLYYGKIIDAINYIFDQHPTISNVRIGRTETSDQVDIRGIELSANYDVNDKLLFISNVTFNRSKIVKSKKNAGNQLRNSPDYFGSFGFIYTDIQLVNVRLFGRFSDDRYFNDENTKLDYYHMKPYLVFDGKIWKDFKFWGGNFTAAIGVDNIFDKIYDAEFPWQAPGRYMEFSLKYFYSL